jgi:hypothetical protein
MSRICTIRAADSGVGDPDSGSGGVGGCGTARRASEPPKPGADMLNHMEIAVAPLAGRCCSRLAAESREPAIHFAGYLRPRNRAATDRTAPHRTAPHRTAPHRTALHHTVSIHTNVSLCQHAFPCCCADPESATPRRPPTQPQSPGWAGLEVLPAQPASSATLPQ